MNKDENIYYPAFLDLRGRLAVVVGGGNIALRKVESLVRAGARVRLVTPENIPGMEEMPGVDLRPGRYSPADLDGAFLVIASTDDEGINRKVSADAHARQVFCNVVDVTDLCSFIVPSVLEMDPIRIAISTGGASPSLARRLRMDIGHFLGDEYAQMANILGRIRPFVLAQPGGYAAHKRVFDILVNSDLLGALRDKDTVLATDILRQALGDQVDLDGIL
ncbi:MAG: bifunctional precorrin-2 dehydrogenase/sirohydrochlorin ferrochelatase [Thermodesulfobacteriota bacterium]|nr:bifunctional precorrin-2 dehydrogenase/sirohydrochlorin ferrochelatase [Thermodesulfobacteriota bacterium]